MEDFPWAITEGTEVSGMQPTDVSRSQHRELLAKFSDQEDS